MQPAAEPTTDDAPPRRRGRKWLIFLLLSALLGAGSGYLASAVWPAGDKPAPPAAEKPSEPKAPPPPPPAPDRTDELIEEAQFAQALEACRAAPGARGTPPPARLYQQGLCLEGLGRPAEAAAAYRACVGDSGDSPLRAAAQLGVARTALQQGRRDEAREALCSLLCRAGQPVAAEAMALLALSLADEALPAGEPSPLRPAALARAAVAPAPERYVRWGRPVKASGGVAAGSLRVAPTGVEAHLEPGPVGERLEGLARAAGLAVTWAPEAREAVKERRAELHCRGAELSDVLLWLALPHGLAATVGEGRLRVRAWAKVKPAERAEIAARAARAAARAAGDHPLAGHLYLALGNLASAGGQGGQAAGWYERVVSERRTSAAVVPAMYNLGLLRLRRGDAAAARVALYEAIDRVPGHAMTALCYWWVARAHLDEGDTAAAQRPLDRAAAAPAEGGADLAVAAALARCCAHLYDGQPREARAALAGQRQAVRRAPFLETAAILDGLARAEMAADDAKRQAAIDAEMAAALLAGRDAEWLGPLLPYLRGRALGRLGMVEEMVALYDRQRGSRRGPLADAMQLGAAEALARQGRGDEARLRLAGLAEAGGRWAGRAQLRLAALDLQAGQAERCLSRCRAALADKQVDRAAALRLMSQAYTALGEYGRSALCLQGKVPPP